MPLILLMNLTLYDLESLKTSCDNLSKLIKEIKQTYNPTNTQRQLFVSRDDYYESLKIKKQNPQDFYYFRLFDIFVQIVYNKSKKVYQIYIDGIYSHVLDKYEKLQDNNKSYIISSCFEDTLLVFQDVVQDIMNIKILSNELF